MNILNKLFGKQNHDGLHEPLKDDAKGKDIVAKVNELVSSINSLADHVATQHQDGANQMNQQAPQPGQIDLEKSKDPAHKAVLTDEFQKLQDGSLAQPGPHAAGFKEPPNPNIPTQQNVPTPLPGGPVPSPSESAQAQVDAANDTDTSKSVTTKQADLLADAKGDAPDA